MQLLNLSLYGREGLWNVTIEGNRLVSTENAYRKNSTGSQQLDAGGALLLPGFINSHEHLDFNCYPRLGNRNYQNYREWGQDIHENNREEIEKVKKIPLELRVKWGMYKNLLNGFTTVINHGDTLFIGDSFINVIQKYPAVHSVAFEKKWKRRLMNPLGRDMIVMHIGEGIDKISADEIDQVIRANIFKKKIVAVHGVSMSIEQASAFAGLVWCPSSNYFLFGKTAELPALAGKISLLFGTDSTLTSTWNVWDQFREALRPGVVTEEQMVDMLTGMARSFWKIDKNTADLFLLKPGKHLFGSGPGEILMVMQSGQIRLVDDSLFAEAKLDPREFHPVRFGTHRKWVYGNLPALVSGIRSYYPGLEVPFIC